MVKIVSPAVLPTAGEMSVITAYVWNMAILFWAVTCRTTNSGRDLDKQKQNNTIFSRWPWFAE
jgi:hypothetical protein